MNIIRIVAACACLILTTTLSSDEGWHGIVPLRSTCEDVKRVLGVAECQFPTSTYYLEDETTTVVFSNEEKPCQGDGQHASWNVPRGTVVEIRVTLKKPPTLANFHVDSSKYEKVFSDFVDEVTYSNYKEGIYITTIKGEVRNVMYTPGANSDDLLCPNTPKPRTQAIPKWSPPSLFDSYGELPFDEEKQRVDNFAEALLKYAPDSQGYIVVYASRDALKGEVKKHAERVKDYLIKTYGIAENRVVTVDGGCHEKMAVELHVGPRGLPPPITFPSVRK